MNKMKIQVEREKSLVTEFFHQQHDNSKLQLILEKQFDDILKNFDETGKTLLFVTSDEEFKRLIP